MNFLSHDPRGLIEKCLYDHGMAERTGWVQPPQTLLFGEIELRKLWVGDCLGKIYKSAEITATSDDVVIQDDVDT